MPYLNLDLDYFTHPKVTRLANILGPESVSLPIKLWCYTGKHFPVTGVLQACTAHDIESAVGWHGEAGKLIENFVKIGFIELKGETYKIHDWKHHAGHLSAFKKRAKTAAKKRWKDYATSKAQAIDKNAKGYAPNLSSPSSSSPSKEEEKKPARPQKLSDEEWFATLKAEPVYQGLDIDRLFQKMRMWCVEHNQHPTRRRFINWLNREDKTLAPHGAAIPPKPPKNDPIARGLWDRTYGGKS